MLKAESAVLHYGKRTVLDGTSLALGRGELVCLIGANGSGKSTLLRALLGLLPLDGGRVTLEDAPISSLGSALAKRVAYLPQGAGIPDMTVSELVLCGRFPHLSYPRRYRGEDRAAAQRAMARVGIERLADCPLSTLSGGERQTAYIAMALSCESDYILLDEPTTYLDPAHAAALLRLLRSLAAEGRGILSVMHDLPMAFDFADRILLLDGGRIALNAPPAEAALSPAVRAALGVSVFPIPNEGIYACRYL